MKAIIGIAAVAAAVFFSGIAQADAATYEQTVPYVIASAIRDTHSAPLSVACVPLAGTTMGVTDMITTRMKLNVRRVCTPLVDYDHSGNLTNWTIWAISTVGHEAAHVRGVWNERTAECAGVHFAMRWMQEQGVFVKYTRSGIRRELLDDSLRPPEYKLRGTCSI